jgi:phage FluMu gp28-like protein
MSEQRHRELCGMVWKELLPFQQQWVENEARFKIGLWARQTGKDMAAAAEAVFDCLLRPGSVWAIVAAGERQALESLRKAREWTETLNLALEHFYEKRTKPGGVLTIDRAAGAAGDGAWVFREPDFD